MRRWSLPLVLAVALSVMLCAGCIKVNMAVAVAPDLSTSAKLVAAFDTSLADMAQSGAPEKPFAELQAKSGGKWQTREYKEGNWQVSEATGHAAPGEALFPPGEGEESPALRVQTSHRRLSTRYDVSMSVPTPPATPTEEKETPKAEDADAAPAPTGEPDMTQAFQGMAESLMSGMDVRVSLTGPGEVIATTGKVAGPGKAEWVLSLGDLQTKAPPDFRVTTELPNWETIGKLANQVVMRGGPVDAGSRILMALQRGLLPNPPANAAAADKLSAIDYLRLVEIIGKIDAGAGPAITDVIIKQARLNDQDATSAQIAAVHEKVMKTDIGLIVEQSSIEGISKGLR